MGSKALSSTSLPVFVVSVVTALLLRVAHSAVPYVPSEAERAWEERLGTAAQLIAKTPSSCVPDNTVVTIIANLYTWELLQLQISRVLGMQCFFDRYLVMTIDSDAYAQCASHTSLKHCVPYYKELGRSDYREQQYMEILYLKIKAAKAIIEKGVSFFFFDTDLVFFRVPVFPPPNYDIICQLGQCDVQCELNSKTQGGLYSDQSPTCHRGQINTGQFGVRPTPLAHELLQGTLSCGKYGNVSNHGTTEQGCLGSLANRMHVKIDNLPSHFAGHCWAKYHLRKMDLTTYHIDCTKTSARKMEVMKTAASRGHARTLGAW